MYLINLDHSNARQHARRGTVLRITIYTALHSHSDTPNVAVQFLVLLLKFWALVTSNLGRNKEYIALNFFLVLLSLSRTLPWWHLKFGHNQSISQEDNFINHLQLLTN